MFSAFDVLSWLLYGGLWRFPISAHTQTRVMLSMMGELHLSCNVQLLMAGFLVDYPTFLVPGQHQFEYSNLFTTSLDDASRGSAMLFNGSIWEFGLATSVQLGHDACDLHTIQLTPC